MPTTRTLQDNTWYYERFGYFTGTFKLEYLRSEPRYPRLTRWGLTRWLGRMLVTDIYEFTLDPENPLTLHMPDGTEMQPDRHFFTDQGSVPHCLDWIITRGQFRAYYPHDSVYDPPHVLYFRRINAIDPDVDVYEFLPSEARCP
jgi:hypothetical protein